MFWRVLPRVSQSDKSRVLLFLAVLVINNEFFAKNRGFDLFYQEFLRVTNHVSYLYIYIWIARPKEAPTSGQLPGHRFSKGSGRPTVNEPGAIRVWICPPSIGCFASGLSSVAQVNTTWVALLLVHAYCSVSEDKGRGFSLESYFQKECLGCV